MSRTGLLPSIIGSGFVASWLLGAIAGISVGVVENEADGAAGAALGVRFDEPAPFVSKDGGFRFQFPGEPKDTVQTRKGANGPLTVHMITCEGPDGTACIISYHDMSAAGLRAAGPDAILEGSIKGLTSGGWKATSTKVIKLGPHPGREIIGAIDEPGAPEPGYAQTRVYLAASGFIKSFSSARNPR